jgi:uncharacterized protein (TIGR02118 family)
VTELTTTLFARERCESGGASMTKVLIMFRKRSDLGMEEFRRYWKETHGPLAAKMPGLRKYVQDHVIADPSQADRPYDAVAELWYESADAYQASMASPEGQVTLADAANFADMDSVRILLADEVTIV